ncbi:trypsin-like serine protease [Candidatus Nanopelagicales bacterium]|nr:trypsin-like serine protease [Candidatus Nanopelagicales bacterium]
MQSRSMPPVRKGHVEWLRRARGRGHGQRPRTPALHLPLSGARPRAFQSQLHYRKFVGAVAGGLASFLFLLPLASTSHAAPSYEPGTGSIGTTTTPPVVDGPSDSASLRTPRLMAAGDASGTPFVTALISVRGNAYGICSAAVWKPTVLMTAGHCVIDENTGGYLDPASFSVANPGTAFRVTGGGVQGSVPVNVVRSFVVDDFQLRGTDVPANDIAFVVLDQPIGDVTFSRLATTVELARWFGDEVPVSALGYGFPSPDNRTTDIPRGAALPILRVLDDFRDSDGLAILSSKINGIDACSGDSGGPRFVIENDAPLLLGNIAGGSCNGQPGAGVIGFTGMSYRPLANAALEVAGLPTIPSRPRDVNAARVQDSTTVWWDAPAESVQTVVGYDVLDSTGALLCTTTETVCAFPTGATGVEDMNVRAKNVQGEGDANLAPDADMLRADAPKAKVLKAKTKKKPVRIRVAPVDYPSVTEYRVTTPKGKTVCTIDPTTSPLNCTVKLGTGKYRFRAVAVTPQGDAVPSRLSTAVRVR